MSKPGPIRGRLGKKPFAVLNRSIPHTKMPSLKTPRLKKQIASSSSFWRISGKTLGQLCLPDFCPRCFWLRQNLAARRIKEPWQIFPGIFSSIDSYSKKIIHGHFDTYGKPPPWLSELGDIVGYRPPPSAQKFYTIDPDTNIQLTGAPDAIFELKDGSLMIGDYKTARYTKNQDALAPLYEGQLNAYHHIAKSLGWAQVTKLVLIYTEPVTDNLSSYCLSGSNSGFPLFFSTNSKNIPIYSDLIPNLLKRASRILNSVFSLLPKTECSDCTALNEIHLLKIQEVA